jgi:hypothetical protein
MATPAQLTANQANAQNSTGPRTPEGKARVSQNAVSHGLTATRLVVRAEDAEELAALQASLAAELDPHGPAETIVFEELLHAAWNLRRFRRIEVELSTGEVADFGHSPNAVALDRLTRYQTRAQRAYYKAVAELRILQTNRALRMLKLEPDIEAEVPAIADINEFAKQTRSEVTAEALKLAMQMTDYQCSTFIRDRRASAAAETAPPPARDAV